jgi:NADH-quinone oxidoreductase subunit E
MCDRAGIRPGETTSHGELTIEAAECLGACDFAPCMLAGDTLHKNLTNETADTFLNTCGIR